MGQQVVLAGAVRDLHDRAAGSLRDEAVSNLAERLKSGDQVGRCTFRDLLACEFDDPIRSRILLEELDTLLCGEGGSDTREGFASRMLDQIIERYLDAHPDLIEEEAAAIANTRDEE